MEANEYFTTRKETQTKYFANLTNKAHSSYIYNVEILTNGDMRYIDYLKKNPADLKLAFAYIVKSETPGAFCRIIVCKDEVEFERIWRNGEDWIITALWEEKQEITIVDEMLAKEC